MLILVHYKTTTEHILHFKLCFIQMHPRFTVMAVTLLFPRKSNSNALGVLEIWSMLCVLDLSNVPECSNLADSTPIQLRSLSQPKCCCPFLSLFSFLFLYVSFFSLSLPLNAGGHYNRSAPRDHLLRDGGCIYHQGRWSSQQGQGSHHHRSRCVSQYILKWMFLCFLCYVFFPHFYVKL